MYNAKKEYEALMSKELKTNVEVKILVDSKDFLEERKITNN